MILGALMMMIVLWWMCKNLRFLRRRLAALSWAIIPAMTVAGRGKCLGLLLSVFISRRAFPYWDHSWPFALSSNTWYNGTKQDPCPDKELFITQDHSLKDACAPWKCLSFYHNLNFLWHILTLPPHFFTLSSYQINFLIIFVKTLKMNLFNINNYE